MPDMECRKQLFDIELTKRPCEENIDTGALARLTSGFTSSDISYMVKETAIHAFEASLKTDDEHTVKISEDMLKEVVSSTRPSVTPDEVRAYERMRDEYMRQNREERRRIGFLA
jgi:SpoVK/Ycf46/Vps4 family AAA+-type ATPase